MNNATRQINIFKRPLLYLLLGVFVFAAVRTDAGEIEPRSYVNTPIGINFLLAGYSYSSGGLATSGSSPLKDADLRMHTVVLAYARSLDILNRPGKIDVILPYSDLSGSALVAGQRRERNVSGLNDPRFRFSVNLYGAPAVSVQEFPEYRQDFIFGASIQVSAPLGQYDREKLVNLGNNRWYVKPDLGISKAWGDFTLELSTGVTFFTDNGDYFGGNNLKQDPVSTTQLHAAYDFGKGIWVALSATYDYGGRTTVSGVESDDLQNNMRLGATAALPVNRNHSLKLFASTGLYTSRGNDYDLVGIAWQFRWGDGL